MIGQGDVQWMTAASGVLHKEYHEEEFSKKGGIFQMVQLWVNLPAKDKMSHPKYQGIVNGEMGQHELPNNSGKIEVIAGAYQNTKGPASTFSPVNMMNAKLNAGGKANFNFPSHYTTTLLVVEGNVKVNGQEVALDHFVIFEKEGESFEVEASENSIALILSGEPLNEPIAMNTQEEIQEAFQDYNMGKFGYLED